MSSPDLTEGLDAFTVQFKAQVDAAGPPATEHAVHFCLALGMQAAYSLPPGSVVFERPTDDRGRIDLWIGSPPDVSIEVKYNRPIPSGRNRPYSQIYGALLADFNKLMGVAWGRRLVILVSDPRAVGHMTGAAGRQLLPFHQGEKRIILPTNIASLSATARIGAESDGPWRPLCTSLIWRTNVANWSLYAWSVEPASSEGVAAP